MKLRFLSKMHSQTLGDASKMLFVLDSGRSYGIEKEQDGVHMKFLNGNDATHGFPIDDCKSDWCDDYRDEKELLQRLKELEIMLGKGWKDERVRMLLQFMDTLGERYHLLADIVDKEDRKELRNASPCFREMERIACRMLRSMKKDYFVVQMREDFGEFHKGEYHLARKDDSHGRCYFVKTINLDGEKKVPENCIAW